ncbi:MAG: SixA phosphatase family protein [Rhizomicrobium sp.]
MRRLLLLRHAKAVQDSGEGDPARRLSGRGREDAALMGRAMNMRGYLPDFALCSPSRRTTETWDLLSAELDGLVEVKFVKGLYLAMPKSIVAAIHNAPDSANTLLLLGHNPGIGECAVRLARTPATKAEARRLADMREKFPTCALAVLDFEAESWRGVDGGGILLEFIRPRDLKS